MLRGASSALSRSTDAAGVLVVGGLLTLLTWVVTPVWVGGALFFPPLVVLAPLALAPAFVLRGYLVRVVAGGGTTGNRDGAPSFVAWNELYRDGLKSTLLSALLLAPLAPLFATVALAGAAAGTGLIDLGPALGFAERALGPAGPPAVVGAGGGLLTVLTAAYLLAFAYVRPAALTAFAASGRLRDGLRPGRVAAVARSEAYATAWVVALATLGAGYALAAPFVPLVVGVAFVFAVRIVAHALYGRGAAGAMDFGVTAPVAPSGSPAAPTGSPSDSAEPVPNRTGASLDRPDGGLPRSAPEAPAAVQTGRTVPLGDSDETPTDADGFEWNVDVGVEGNGGPESPVADDSDRTPPTGDGDGSGFEWRTRVGTEDKS
ncbi:DUF4013 domain-containing protein [Halorubrum sp. Boch-26]|uniref:DUF4013 domain-containing protein n=1 Tax=Halorubrum sp. Boch-26 TaxID=2994426 RepID=UPI00246958F7|nr:DUF4013 domain-containing protein [Halorubrum sp. Boch-26]